MTEEWRVIADFPEYAVSSLGRVKRIIADRKGRLSGTLMRPTPDTDGYLQVNLFRECRAVTNKVHALVCTQFVGPRPTQNHEVAHGDGKLLNNRFDNLRWATPKENASDRDLHGRTSRGDNHPARIRPGYLPTGDAHWSRKRPELTTRGERHGMVKLTTADVISIRSDARPGVEIAAEYGVTPSAVCAIRKRRSWKHIA